MSESENKEGQLSTGLRWYAAILGFMLIGSAFFILYFSPVKFERELTDNGFLARSTNSSADVTTPFIAVLTAGVAVLLFALNGLRFAKFSAGGVTAEALDAQEKAKVFYKTDAADRPESTVTVPNKMSPEPTEVPTGYLEAADGKYAVYKLNELPFVVIVDALASWPTSETKPADLSGFEFATRKTGKGNHPWTLKFKGKKAIVVSYGGQGKSGPTVSSAQQS